MAQRLSGVMA